jgi:energy-converting hydrogenase Eha subunit C
MNEKTQKRLNVINRQNISKYGTGAVLSVGLMGAVSPAFALDVGAATSGSDANSNIELGATFVLTITVLIFSARKVIGFFSR